MRGILLSKASKFATITTTILDIVSKDDGYAMATNDYRALAGRAVRAIKLRPSMKNVNNAEAIVRQLERDSFIEWANGRWVRGTARSAATHPYNCTAMTKRTHAVARA